MSNPKRQIDTLDVFHRGGSGSCSRFDAAIVRVWMQWFSPRRRPPDLTAWSPTWAPVRGPPGFAVVSRCSGSHAILVERDAEMAEYASRSAGLEQNRHLRERLSVLAADVSLTGSARKTAGLGDRSFDFAIMNPPFNDASDRQTQDELKRRAHVMNEGIFEAWIRTAAAIVKPGRRPRGNRPAKVAGGYIAGKRGPLRRPSAETRPSAGGQTGDTHCHSRCSRVARANDDGAAA